MFSHELLTLCKEDVKDFKDEESASSKAYMDYTVHGILQNSEVGSLSLLQGVFPTQGSNPGLPDCRQILYQLSHQKSPRILE